MITKGEQSGAVPSKQIQIRNTLLKFSTSSWARIYTEAIQTKSNFTWVSLVSNTKKMQSFNDISGHHFNSQSFSWNNFCRIRYKVLKVSTLGPGLMQGWLDNRWLSQVWWRICTQEPVSQTKHMYLSGKFLIVLYYENFPGVFLATTFERKWSVLWNTDIELLVSEVDVVVVQQLSLPGGSKEGEGGRQGE